MNQLIQRSKWNLQPEVLAIVIMPFWLVLRVAQPFRCILDQAIARLLQPTLLLQAAEKPNILCRNLALNLLLATRTDAAKLRQTLLNLLVAAVNFATTAGYIIYKVSVKDEATEEAEVSGNQTSYPTLSSYHPPVALHDEVEDAGSGTHPGEILQLFETVAPSTNRRSALKGNDLGLKTSRKFISLDGRRSRCLRCSRAWQHFRA